MSRSIADSIHFVYNVLGVPFWYRKVRYTSSTGLSGLRVVWGGNSEKFGADVGILFKPCDILIVLSRFPIVLIHRRL